jgi:hypothetical protein
MNELYGGLKFKKKELLNHDGVSQGGTDMADGLLYALGQRLKPHDHTGVMSGGAYGTSTLPITPQWPSGGHWVDAPPGNETVKSFGDMLKEGINDYTENDLLLELRDSVNKWLEPVKL